jgi:hypothetical protein
MLLLLTEEFRYDKSRLAQLAIAVGLMLTVAGLLLLTQSAFADEKYDKKVCEDYNGEWKVTGSNGNRGCVIENEKDQKMYSIRPGYSLDGTSADAEYGREDLGIDDEEVAAIEDAVCNNEDADTTNVKSCMSDKREKQMEDIKDVCDKVGGVMSKDGCATDSDGPKADKFEELIFERIEEQQEQEDEKQHEEETEGLEEQDYENIKASPIITDIKEILIMTQKK